jgi:hypothetical protein
MRADVLLDLWHKENEASKRKISVLCRRSTADMQLAAVYYPYFCF